MARLEDLKPGVVLDGILPNGQVTVVSVRLFGTEALELVYKDAAGRPGTQLVYRNQEATLEIVADGRPWDFQGDGMLFRLVSEAYRIKLAYLFDPLLAVHTSLVRPLPHQITAVYNEMLTRQPLRFLLADDPGAGKTIMAGLLIKELLLRGDVERCMVVCPGSLVEQWQQELDEKFHLPFEILTNDKLESARTGNWFQENDLVICRLDKLSRDQDVQARLESTDWDLIVVDEAHKMSASYFGSEVKYTKRFQLGQLLSRLTRHFLLMTATPHNGKEADFQLFMSLLDSDRFEGHFRDGVHLSDASDLMRRLVKEQLVTFDGKALFPERRAYTVPYTLSADEARLYSAVTNYVRDEFNRADQLANNSVRSTVGFALTTLQRRLASSPEAIYQSLRRRRSRLEKRREDVIAGRRGAAPAADLPAEWSALSPEQLEDLEDAPGDELEQTEEQVVDLASAAVTIAELEKEIAALRDLEVMAEHVVRSGRDRKWEELAGLLQDRPEMFDEHGNRRKLVVFTEHRDTLAYLQRRLTTLLGRPESVATIHGGMGRDARRAAQDAFLYDPSVHILLATDAAGEGINLQRAHLMVNYDLPWNPNRLEQRFGRIHRIGQTEVCHLWNLVAEETREGTVYYRLLEKLNQERAALGGRVFDVLGKLTFANQSLRDLLIEAVRYGERPDVRARLDQVVDEALDRSQLEHLLEERSLARDTFDSSTLRRVREEMERAEARRLQPHHIGAFFLKAFEHLGGSIRRREPGRYQITHVPAVIQDAARRRGRRDAVQRAYERVTFEKDLVAVQGRPLAAFICPGHPLLDATIEVILERYRNLLRHGAVLLDEQDSGVEPRVLVYLEHAIQDATIGRDGARRVISRQMQFVELNRAGEARAAGFAPYLDYEPLPEEDLALVEPLLQDAWLGRDLEDQALLYAVNDLVPRHEREVSERRQELIAKTRAAVRDRLTKEIAYWDRRATELRAQEQAGKTPALNSARAQERAEDLDRRLRWRMAELDREAQIASSLPVVIGSALIVPAGLLAQLRGEPIASPHAVETARVERLAMEAVMEAERQLGFQPRDVSAGKVGWDIESRDPRDGHLRFIEVKGRAKGAATVTVTHNEIIRALNLPDDFILAVVEVDEVAGEPLYVRRPFRLEPDFGVTSVTYSLGKLLETATPPA